MVTQLKVGGKIKRCRTMNTWKSTLTKNLNILRLNGNETRDGIDWRPVISRRRSYFHGEWKKS